jgi:hypothetical protein
VEPDKIMYWCIYIDSGSVNIAFSYTDNRYVEPDGIMYWCIYIDSGSVNIAFSYTDNRYVYNEEEFLAFRQIQTE